MNLNVDKDSDDDRNKWIQQYSIIHTIRHPEYTERSHYNDIALVRLNQTVNITEYVVPVCLWADKEEIKKNIVFHASGFGVKESEGSFLGKLSKVELQISPINDCASKYTSNLVRKLPHGLNSSHLCTIDPNFTQKSTCKVWKNLFKFVIVYLCLIFFRVILVVHLK